MDELVAQLVKGAEDIKDFRLMVEWFAKNGVKSYNFVADEEMDAQQKWKKTSDMFKGLGYSFERFSPDKCRDRFYEWSAFYAKNYDKLNGKIEAKMQELFDLLKIIHILDFTKIWTFDNRTHILLKQISEKSEIQSYLMECEMKKLTIIDKSRGSDGSVWKSDDSYGRMLYWKDMNLNDDLMRSIGQLKFKPPSIIQQQAIIPYINGRDVIAQAQSGTGKTAAFAIAILQKIETSINKSQALILAPTRELARQIHDEVSQLGKYMKVRCHTSIGGTSATLDAMALVTGFHIVIGTPGRILHMIQVGALLTDYIKFFVLDECDQLLDVSGKVRSNNRKLGFKEQINDIFKALQPTVQVFLSSATMPPEVLHKSEEFMKNPFQILVKDEELTLRGLDQFYINAGNEGFKFDTFLDLYQRIIKCKEFETSKIQIFVYCNTKEKVIWVVNMMEIKAGIIVAGMHSGTKNRFMAQNEREMILNEFRKGSSRVLITTDLLGRGIDVTDVEIVINYDMPDDNETYMHRVGRSGRFGRTGKAINLTTDEQSGRISELQMFYHTQIDPLPDNLF